MKCISLKLTCPLFIVICLVSTTIMNSLASATTYQSGVGMQFTFNPTLTISLSDTDLTIENLVSGTYADSNIITVSINTNVTNGYTLSATAGSSDYSGSTNFNANDLILTNGLAVNTNETNKFTSLLPTDSFDTMDSADNNTWGYSFSSDAGNNWTSYKGLPLYTATTGAELISTEASADSDSIQFKIGAKASNDKATGEYTNIVNFVAVANPVPTTLAMAYAAANSTQKNGYYTLQGMTSSICNAVDLEDDELQVIDTRDDKIYWIAKLKDGHCWMTQNLDLDIEHAANNVSALNSANTDLNQFGSNGYTTDHGYSCSNPNTTTNCTAAGEVISWAPLRDTIDIADLSNETFPKQTPESHNTGYSLDIGDWYYAGYDGTLLTSTDINFITSPDRVESGSITTVNDGNETDYYSTAPFAANGEHGHLGNYYNWSAAVASDYTYDFVDDTIDDIEGLTTTGNPKNSICPAGWRLPTISTQSETIAGSTDEFRRLNYLYNDGLLDTSLGLEAAPLYFPRAGIIWGDSLNHSGSHGYAWSSTTSSDAKAYYLDFFQTGVDPMYNSNHCSGRAVRCVAR